MKLKLQCSYKALLTVDYKTGVYGCLGYIYKMHIIILLHSVLKRKIIIELESPCDNNSELKLTPSIVKIYIRTIN